MKTSTIYSPSEKCCNEEKPQKAMAGKVMKYLLFTFMFIQIFVLYSCEVVFHTPRHHRNGVVIENYDNNGHHDNGKHKGDKNH